MPILDLKVGLTPNDEGGSHIDHKFFKKSMAREEILASRTALPVKTKFNILVEEGYRRVKNFNLSTDWSEKEKELKEFNKQLKKDGHSEEFRLNITKKVLDKYETAINEDKAEVKPFYRTRKEREKDQVNKKKGDKVEGYKRRGYEAKLLVDHTPASKLARNINKRLKREMPDTKILVQESAGKKVKSLATNSIDPWEKPKCDRDKCYQCNTSRDPNKIKGRCWAQNSTYSIECLKCKEEGNRGIYIGESKSTYQRCKQHCDSLRRKSKDCVLWNHVKNEHPNDEEDADFKMFEFKPGRQCKGALQKQAAEGAEIIKVLDEKNEKEKNGNSQVKILNSKAEFNQPAGVLTARTVKVWD